MTWRKINIDNSVKYIQQSEQIQSFSKDRGSKPKTIKKISLLRLQNKKLSQINKECVKNVITGEWFRKIKWIMNCYF